MRLLLYDVYFFFIRYLRLIAMIHHSITRRSRQVFLLHILFESSSIIVQYVISCFLRAILFADAQKEAAQRKLSRLSQKSSLRY